MDYKPQRARINKTRSAITRRCGDGRITERRRGMNLRSPTPRPWDQLRGPVKIASAFEFRRCSMQVPPVQSSSSSAPAAARAPATPQSQDLNNMFLQLLVTQLKSQSPLDPL